MEIERLDVLLKALWPTALATGHNQQARAVEDVLSIMARRSALLGLDAAQRVRVEYVDDDTLTELLERLMPKPPACSR